MIEELQTALETIPMKQFKDRDMIIDDILDCQKEYKAYTGDYYRGKTYNQKV